MNGTDANQQAGGEIGGREALDRLAVLERENRELRESLLDPFGPLGLAEWRAMEPGYGLSSPYLFLGDRRGDREQGRNRPWYETEEDLGEIRAQARALATIDAVGVGVVGKLTDYIVGDGVTVEASATRPEGAAVAEVVQAVLDELYDDNDFCGDLDRQIFAAAIVDGDAPMVLWHVGGGRTQLRLAEPEQLTEPQNPRALEESLGIDQVGDWDFGVHTLAGDVQSVLGYHFQWTVGQPQDFAYLDRDRVELIKTPGTSRNVKRGMSEFFPVVQWLRKGEKLLGNTADGAAIQAAIAWIEQYAAGATPQAAESDRLTGAADRMALRGRTPGGQATTRTVQHVPGGTVLKIGGGRQFQAGPAGSERAPNFLLVEQAILRVIGSRWSMPEYMVSGDASNANYASTMVAESPFVRRCQANQAYYKRRFHSIFWKAVAIAEAAGRFRHLGVNYAQIERLVSLAVEFPPLVVRDDKSETERLKTLREAGVLSRRTWAQKEGVDLDQEEAQGAAPVDARPALPVATETQPEAETTAATAETQALEVAPEQALNGAQLQAALTIVQAVANGELPRDAGIGQLMIGFNIDRPKAELMMGSAGAGFTPAKEEEPAEVKESWVSRWLPAAWRNYP